MDSKIRVWNQYHWLALGFLIGVFLTTGAIWYGVPGHAQTNGQPINIPVTASGWKFGTSSGPNGTNGCFAGYGGKCVQDLGVSPAHFQEYRSGYAIGGFYTVTFSATNHFQNYPGYLTAQISYGTQELCSPPDWGMGVPTQITVVCHSPGYLIVDKSLSCDQNPCIVGPAQGNNNLVLTVSVNGWPVSSDNFSVTFTPTP